MKLLVDNGADFSNGWPLKYACIVGNKEIVNFLIEKGADVQVQNNEALVVACYNGRTEIVKILIENSFKSSFLDEDEKKIWLNKIN